MSDPQPEDRAKPAAEFPALAGYEPTGGPGGAAFFDFDKTLLDGDAGVIFGRSLAGWAFEQGAQFPMKPMRNMWNVYVGAKVAKSLATELFFRSLYGVRVLKRSQLVRQGYRLLKGLPSEDMAERMKLVWDRVLADRLYPEMRYVMDQHKALGQRVVIVTTGLRPIVELSKRSLGDDIDIIACDLEVDDDGAWTGRVLDGPLYGADKAIAIARYADEHGVDLARSYAYSDHYSDYAFLDAVGHPVCVNPKRRLRNEAEERGWTILDVPRLRRNPLLGTKA